ncbi:sec-independent protein translocase protein TatC [Chitinophaga sp. W2I13]
MLKKLFASNEDKAEMSFFDHLEDLRWHLVRSALALVAFSVFGFLYTEEILDNVIFGPTNADFPSYVILCKISHWIGMGDRLCITPVKVQFLNYKMVGQIMLQFKLAFMIGFICAFPYIFWEFWRFVKPALKERELKGARGVIFWVSFQFFLGIGFAYFLMAPFTINFLASYTVTAKAVNQFFIDDYFDLMTQIVLGMGILFELAYPRIFPHQTGHPHTGFPQSLQASCHRGDPDPGCSNYAAGSDRSADRICTLILSV